jgi:hypothetical protein
MKFNPQLILLYLALLAPSFSSFAALGEPTLSDKWNRNLRGAQIILIDWEGQIANPAPTLKLSPPPEARFPVTAEIRANSGRIYFNQPSRVDPLGPTKTLTFTSASQVLSFRVAIFPDHDFASENYLLTINSRDADGQTNQLQIPIQVHDHDRERPPEFNLIVDKSRDTTAFFVDPAKLAIAQQSARDWAYFIADMIFDHVAQLAETSFIWAADGSNTGTRIRNAQAYEGYLLYIYGVHGPNLISGGQGSWDGGLQSRNGVSLNIRRSGTYQAHTLGNYNTRGWFLTTSDNDWLATGNLQHETNDLYSIAHHEIGHSLFFDGSHPLFAAAKAKGSIDDPPVVAYFGAPITMNNVNHFVAQVDPESGFGAFGNEYNSLMPARRWLITKLDLLCAQATGYELRPTSAFDPLRITTSTNLKATLNEPFSTNLTATGGVPSYSWTVNDGTLPLGLMLNSFTGQLSGAPSQSGDFQFNIRLEDSSQTGTPVTNTFHLNITAALKFQITPTASSLQLQLSGPPGSSAEILESTNLTDWTPFRSNQTLPFEESINPKSQSYFRAVLHPALPTPADLL